ncbi:MAG: hydroxymethylbilane synthase [Acidaminococcaceae bacterium]|nr:hydroxymethylbilane synthase [Acidaminococcaceae bacterium]
MKITITIGTRKSLLALWQSNYIKSRLETQYPDCEVRLQKIVTKGDKILDVPLSKIGGKGLFTKEIETALLDGEVDLAVHSLKDMPTKLPDGLCLTAITERAVVGDAFVSNKYNRFAEMPAGAVLGTSSLRRKAQLLAKRPDLDIRDLRGNVDTRLHKLDEGQYDAIILAAAGLTRLGYAERIKETLPCEFCIPAVGQGALAIECRTDNKEVRAMLEFLNHPATKRCTDAERAFLGLVEGGCQVPIGVHAEAEGNRMHIVAIIASLDGSTLLRDEIDGDVVDAVALGQKLGRRMLANGGKVILDEIL